MRIAAGLVRPILSDVKKDHRSRALAVSLLVAASAAFQGCGGFSGSHSVSPATILLPGLLKADPVPARVPGRVPGNPVGPTDRIASFLPGDAAIAPSVTMASLPGSPSDRTTPRVH